jgi:hypothetical protein
MSSQDSETVYFNRDGVVVSDCGFVSASGQYALTQIASVRAEVSHPWFAKLGVGSVAGLVLLASLALVWDAARYMAQDGIFDAGDLSLLPYGAALGCLLSAAALTWALSRPSRARLTLGGVNGEAVLHESTDAAFVYELAAAVRKATAHERPAPSR